MYDLPAITHELSVIAMLDEEGLTVPEFLNTLMHIAACDLCADDSLMSRLLEKYHAETNKLHICQQRAEIEYLVNLNHAEAYALELIKDPYLEMHDAT